MMAAANNGDTYFCHICETEIVPNLQDFTCPSCHSGFIEALTLSEPTDATETGLLEMFHQWWNIRLGDNTEETFSLNENHSSSDEESVPVEPEPTRTRRYARQSGRTSRERVITSASRRPRISGNQFIGSNRLFHLPFITELRMANGSFHDYVFDRELFDQLVTLLMNEVQVGPPPASEDAIADLPVSLLTEEQALKLGMCSICFDDFKVSESVVKLPCTHVYHQTCVTTWLKQHGTCPVCRKDLAGRDTSRLEDPGTGVSRNGGSSSSIP